MFSPTFYEMNFSDFYFLFAPSNINANIFFGKSANKFKKFGFIQKVEHMS